MVFKGLICHNLHFKRVGGHEKNLLFTFSTLGDCVGLEWTDFL